MSHLKKFNNFMDKALCEARKAYAIGEVPVGAVVVCDGKIIGRGHNLTRHLHDATAHAEMRALGEASRTLGTAYLLNCDLYVTLEPCAMCAGALSWARIRRVYIGAEDPKSGSVFQGARVFDHPQCHHKPEIIDDIMAAESEKLLAQFFQELRRNRPKK